jgi:hypothetical protein
MVGVGLFGVVLGQGVGAFGTGLCWRLSAHRGHSALTFSQLAPGVAPRPIRRSVALPPGRRAPALAHAIATYRRIEDDLPSSPPASLSDARYRRLCRPSTEQPPNGAYMTRVTAR